MGLLIDGKWHDKWYDTDKTGGKFEREAARFRNWVTADGSPGPDGEGGFKAESGRYHLYVSMACPWAHRTLIFRKLKGLEKHISVSVVHPDMVENGWEFRPDSEQHRDHLHGFRFMHQVYTKAAPEYSGRVTVPTLWDKKKETIASNESAEIIRMFNSAFDGLEGVRTDLDFYPGELQEEIDSVNARVYDTVNNGVYKAGFATAQDKYEEAYNALFDSLDWLEERLSSQRYLVGGRLTEADWRLFTTLIRFDAVYYSHFKCNRQRISDFPALSAYVRDLYQVPGVAETVDINQIKRHYYVSQRTINPTQIVPVGPELDFDSPHGRESLS
ncbi:putative glutathione S-transferase [Marinobacter sp. DSM 26671]|jgi:glutathionyl-hydroquinone reductase|uniref:Putative glutathione S-transferase n=1 Tax=Marinobacter manganoxydans MnI7-9 TaxID=1094979 RepID=G6YPV4_9GAMM|nr:MULTISPECIES: glutathione S-transferase family protein [Marinobacter]PTB82326.1 glutathione S-transferase family protein [Marinobacter sp. Z-D5-3]EHJ05730.1 putative glutathione S-transferase [Marinobacter manganoxydans MnI7-9]MAK49467.1 glutathione S-transferase family protein [Marinobacter sp.]MBI48006.1 glutathione S-transferase family protein [Marinobacter sp.]SFE71215.1 putative glutathione S-transferase [Marinobacter sp. DSM 26671]|tara:strand:- start:608 stop:1594 length:987 start_codon:yes stop_codon:yes gene_type:complete